MRPISWRYLLLFSLTLWHDSPASAAPSANPMVLFDGTGTKLFVNPAGSTCDWPIKNGALVSTPNSRRSNNLVSQLHFCNAEIELEFLQPRDTDGNSGVFLHGLYEIQLLTSVGKQKLTNRDMGAIYGLHAPLVNADLGPGEWQKLKILFYAPRRDATGKIIAEGVITAWLNGKKIHDAVQVGNQGSNYNPYVYDTTPYLAEIHRIQNLQGTGPLLLQDHDCPVQFRQVRITSLDDAAYLYMPAAKDSGVPPQRND